MKPIEKSDRIVVNVESAQFRPFLTGGSPIAGQSYLQLDDSFPPGTRFHLYPMAPGSSSQPYEHTCAEQFLVLDGEVTDHDGFVYRRGDLVLLPQGTQHASRTETGAALAVFVATAERNL